MYVSMIRRQMKPQPLLSLELVKLGRNTRHLMHIPVGRSACIAAPPTRQALTVVIRAL